MSGPRSPLLLRCLGALEVCDLKGRPLPAVLAQSKRAALLAYLAISRPGLFHRRDALLALFWPDLDQSRGRNALSQALSFLRRELGRGVLLTRGPEEVGVDGEAIDCDVLKFLDAVENRRWAEALEAYRGDLLEGLHVTGTIAFADWVDRERTRLRQMAARAAWALAHERIADGELVEAERTAHRALGLVPTDESPVREFVDTLGRAGDRGAALRFYETFVGVLARELEVEPARETAAVVEKLRKGEVAEAGGTRSVSRAAAARDVEAQRDSDPEAGGVPALLPPDPPRRRRRIWLTSAVLAGALALVGYVSLLDSRAGGAETLMGTGLGPSPRVVVTDFAFPADPELGRALGFCLTIALDQSDLIRPVDPSALGAALQRMMRPPSGPLDGETAHEIAVRDGYPMVVVTEMAAVDDGYLLTARLEAADTREVLGRFSQVAPEGLEALQPAVDRLGADIRRRIGDSRRSIRRSLPLEQVTTPSLEALRLYTHAARIWDTRGSWGTGPEVIDLYERAIDIDSAFASAYRRLWVVLGSAENRGEERQAAARKAYENRDRLTEFERLRAEEAYALETASPGSTECQGHAHALRLYSSYVRLHPRDPRPLHQYAYHLYSVGRRQEAIDAYRRAIDLGQDLAVTYYNLVGALVEAGDHQAAREILDEVRERHGENPSYLVRAAHAAYRRGELAAADSLYAEWQDRYGGQAPFFLTQLDAVRGRMQEAAAHHEELERTLLQASDLRRVAYGDVHWALTRMINLGRPDSSSLARAARSFDAMTPGEVPTGVLVNAGMLFALAGDPERTREILGASRDRGIAGWSLVRGLIPAMLQLTAGEPEAALATLDAAEPECELGNGTDMRWFPWLRGRLYEGAGRSELAIDAFTGVVDGFAGSVEMRVWWDAVFLFDALERLARLHDRLGHRNEAAAYYLRAAELWKDADPELQPRVQLLRERAAALASSGAPTALRAEPGLPPGSHPALFRDSADPSHILALTIPVPAR